MKKLFSITLAALLTTGALVIHLLPSSGPSPAARLYRIAYVTQADANAGSSGQYDKKRAKDRADKVKKQEKTLVAEMAAIERQMKDTTAVLQQVIDQKASVLNKSLKTAGITPQQKQQLKDAYRQDTNELYQQLHAMQRPFMEQMVAKQQQYHNLKKDSAYAQSAALLT